MILDQIAKAIEGVGQRIEQGAEWLGSEIESGLEQFGKAIEQVWSIEQSITKGTFKVETEATKDIARRIESIPSYIRHGAEHIGAEIEAGAGEVARRLEGVGKEIEQGAESAWHKVEQVGAGIERWSATWIGPLVKDIERYFPLILVAIIMFLVVKLIGYFRG